VIYFHILTANKRLNTNSKYLTHVIPPDTILTLRLYSLSSKSAIEKCITKKAYNKDSRLATLL